MKKPKIEVMFSPTAGWAYHARRPAMTRTLCGRPTGGWAVHGTDPHKVECRACLRALTQLTKPASQPAPKVIALRRLQRASTRRPQLGRVTLSHDNDLVVEASVTGVQVVVPVTGHVITMRRPREARQLVALLLYGAALTEWQQGGMVGPKPRRIAMTPRRRWGCPR